MVTANALKSINLKECKVRGEERETERRREHEIGSAKRTEATRCREQKNLKGCALKRVKQAYLGGRKQATGKAKKE